MAHVLLALTVVSALVLVAVFLVLVPKARQREIRVRADPTVDPLLARPRLEPPSRGPRHPRRFVAGVLLLALALTAFGITVTVDLGAGLVWAALGVVLLYPAVVFLETAGLGRAGPS